MLKVLLWIFCFIIGTVIWILYFIYNPKAAIKEKKNNLETTGNYKIVNGETVWETDWWKTFISYDFWCPYLLS